MLKRAPFIILIISLVVPLDAIAGNANSFFMGNEASMTAGAIAAHTRDSEAIWYNPAGLGGNNLTRLNLSGTAFELRLQKVKNGITTILPSGTDNASLNGNEYLAVPTTLTFMRYANDKVSYGFGVFMPLYEDFSFNNSLSSNENFPGIPETVTYEQGYDLDILQAQYQIGGAVGWQASDRLRLGSGLFFVYTRSRINQDQFSNIKSADGSGTTSLFYVDNYRALISTLGLRGTVGSQIELNEKWKTGVMLFTPTFQIVSWGDMSANQGSVTLDSMGNLDSSANRVYEKIKEFSFAMVEPFHAQLSVAYEEPTYWVGATADVYIPLKKNNLLIDKKTNWNVAVGGKFRINDKFNFGAGFFTDNSASKEPEMFGEGKVNYYGITTGGEFQTPISREGGRPILFTTVLSIRYALGIGKVGGESIDTLAGQNITNGTLTINDVYFHELSAYIGTGLYF